MRTRCAIVAVGVCLATGALGWALDSVKTTSATISGKVTGIDRHTVVVDRGVPKKVPVNEIVMVHFDDDSTTMKTARSHLLGGRYKDALEAFNKVDPQDVRRPEIKQDLEFYQALCAARLALGGTGTIKEAGGRMIKFARANPQSYHYLEACEVIGDLLVAIGAYAQAEEYYARLGQAPWPDYKMRAGVTVGRARLAQGKAAAALESFESVIANNATGDLAESQRLAATLGKARCLSAEQHHDQAIQLVEDILAKADPEQVELHARAYNTLGTALKKAGRTKEALLAFLHVDVLYFTTPEAHAEALANLAELWKEVHKPERAVKARQILQERYGGSPWAKKGGA